MVSTAENSRHPNDEDLLAYVDGELKWGKRRRVRVHLESCWECRNRTRKIEAAIAEFVSLRNEWASSPMAEPRTDQRGFEARLKRMEKDSAGSSAWRRLFSRPARFLWRLAPQAVIAGALLALAWVWLGTREIRSVSAAEFLERAAAVESLQLARIDQPVVYRELEVRRIPAGGEEGEERTARLEYWLDTGRDRSRQSGAAGLWDELDEVFRANRMAGTAPLTVEAYQAWRAAARPEEEVTTLQQPDGEKVLALRGTAASTGARNEILEHELIVRATDWHPVQQTLRVRRDPGIIEYQFTEIVFEVVPLSSLPEDLFAHADEAKEAIRRALGSADSRAAGAGQAAPDSRVLEVKVRYQLHLAGACRQDLVRIRLEAPARIHVRGIVDTAARREELLSALQQLEQTDAVKIDIKSVEEASTAGELFEALEGLDFSRSPLGQRAAAAPSGPGPLLPLVHERLGDELSADDLRRRSHDASAEAVALVSASVLESAVLERLAESYGGSGADLPPQARKLVGLMVRDHARALDEKLARLEKLLGALLFRSPDAPPGETAPEAGVEIGGRNWAELARRQADIVARLQRSTDRLFTSDEAETPPPLDEVRAAMVDTHGVCVALRRTVAQVLEALEAIEGVRTTSAARVGPAAAARE